MNSLSVIIPAYNAVRTIGRTLHSVLASTVSLDVYAVDDGSTDGTGEWLDAFALKGEIPSGFVLHVIHKENEGAYKGRLAALRQIATPYFGFVDADDTVEPDMFAKMLTLAQREDLDVVECEHDRVQSGGAQRGEQAGRGERKGHVVLLRDRNEVFRHYIRPRLLDIKESSFIWNKIYRNQYDFVAFEETDNVTNFDDMIFNLQFFLSVGRMGIIDEALYHYSETEGSAVKTFNDGKIKDLREAARIRDEYLPKYGVRQGDPMYEKWIVLNARSAVLTAARAEGTDAAERSRLLKKVAFLPEVSRAFARRPLRCVVSISGATVLLARLLPAETFMRIVKTIRRCLAMRKRLYAKRAAAGFGII